MKIILFILCVIIGVHAYAQEIRVKYKLTEIDTSTLSEYYMFRFINIDEHKKVIVISSKNTRALKGCWEYFKLDEVYSLYLYKIFTIKMADVWIPINGGFGNEKGMILQPGDFFYCSEQINGLFVNVQQ